MNKNERYSHLPKSQLTGTDLGEEIIIQGGNITLNAHLLPAVRNIHECMRNLPDSLTTRQIKGNTIRNFWKEWMIEFDLNSSQTIIMLINPVEQEVRFPGKLNETIAD